MTSKHVCRRLLAAERPLAWLMLCAYGLAMLGGPLAPSHSADSRFDGGMPYPCQAHQCGCKSAAQCWRSCCCSSLSERLAWAKFHCVEPPTELVAAAEHDDAAHGADHDGEHGYVEQGAREQSAREQSVGPAHDHDHCSSSVDVHEHAHEHHDEHEHPCDHTPHVAMSQTAGAAASEKAACCHTGKARRLLAHRGSDNPAPDANKESADLPGVKAPRCHGIATLWVTNGAATCPPPALAWSFDWCPAGDLPLLAGSCHEHSRAPAVPPPRV